VSSTIRLSSGWIPQYAPNSEDGWTGSTQRTNASDEALADARSEVATPVGAGSRHDGDMHYAHATAFDLPNTERIVRDLSRRCQRRLSVVRRRARWLAATTIVDIRIVGLLSDSCVGLRHALSRSRHGVHERAV